MSRHATDRVVSARKWAKGRAFDIASAVAEEAPVALVYNGVSHAVMMATPADLADFARGFSVSEGIVAHADEVLDCVVVDAPPGIEVRIDITQRRFQALKDRRRNLTGRTGCGLCGVDSLAQAVRPISPVVPGPSIEVGAVERALADLSERQTINRRTHSLHAAAWADAEGRLRVVREDVGRHNALDKSIGQMAALGLDPTAGFALITSRCSFEMVQKAATFGIGMIVAISAPTALALDLAESAGVTLVALARSDSVTAFTHCERLIASKMKIEVGAS